MRASVLSLGALLLVQVLWADVSFADEQLDSAMEKAATINIDITDQIVYFGIPFGICECDFKFKVQGDQVKWKSVRCNKQCTGRAYGVELEANYEGYNYKFTVGLVVKSGKGRITKATVEHDDYGACPPTNIPAITITDWPCPLKDVGFTGPCRLHINISSWELCALMCHQDPDRSCNYWGYQTNGTDREGPWGNEGDCWFQTDYASTTIAPGRRSGNSDCISGGPNIDLGNRHLCLVGAAQLITSGACKIDCPEGGEENCKTCLGANLPDTCQAESCTECVAGVAGLAAKCIWDNTHLWPLPPSVNWVGTLQCIYDGVPENCKTCVCDLACDFNHNLCGIGICT